MSSMSSNKWMHSFAVMHCAVQYYIYLHSLLILFIVGAWIERERQKVLFNQTDVLLSQIFLLHRVLSSKPQMCINIALRLLLSCKYPDPFLYSVQWLCVCVSAISTEKCVSVCQWLIAVLAQQLWGCRPHCDVSVAMETVGRRRGLDKDEERGEGQVTEKESER